MAAPPDDVVDMVPDEGRDTMHPPQRNVHRRFRLTESDSDHPLSGSSFVRATRALRRDSSQSTADLPASHQSSIHSAGAPLAERPTSHPPTSDEQELLSFSNSELGAGVAAPEPTPLDPHPAATRWRFPGFRHAREPAGAGRPVVASSQTRRGRHSALGSSRDGAAAISRRRSLRTRAPDDASTHVETRSWYNLFRDTLRLKVRQSMRQLPRISTRRSRRSRVLSCSQHASGPRQSRATFDIPAAVDIGLLMLAAVLGAAALVVAAVALDIAQKARAMRAEPALLAGSPPPPPAPQTYASVPAAKPGQFVATSRIAFGSKYQSAPGNNPIWLEAIIPAKPDAWIWTGNMAFLSQGPLNCTDSANAQHPTCTCEQTYLRSAPDGCLAGSFSNAQAKMADVLASTGYAAFLEYMCPGYYAAKSAVPPGTDPWVCPRPILGIYGDSDYGWRGGDRRMPDKGALKQVFLDGIGAPPGSVQRAVTRGAYEHVKLPSQVDNQWVDVIMLDERYERAPLPCHTRREHCQLPAYATTKWCVDFLGKESVSSPGSCCKQDDAIERSWCRDPASVGDPRYGRACEPWRADFGQEKYALNYSDGSLLTDPPDDWRHMQESEGFCDVLGKTQRTWLRDILRSSASTLKVVVAPSGILGNPFLTNSANNAFTGYCDNDWDCYRPAQASVLHMLSNTAGCVVVLSGDPPYADFKAARASSVLPYAGPYAAKHLNHSVYQVSTAGMHPSTAPGVDKSCGAPCCGRDIDSSGLRIGGVCALYGQPSFGMLTIDWEMKELKMQILKADGSGVVLTESEGAGGPSVAMELDIDLRFCLNKAKA